MHLTFCAFFQESYNSSLVEIDFMSPAVIHGLFSGVRFEHLGFSSLNALSNSSLNELQKLLKLSGGLDLNFLLIEMRKDSILVLQ